MTTFKFDPVSQCSEVSLLKDLINQENQLKFLKQNLNEVKIAFYNRNQKQQSSYQNRFNSICQSIEIDERHQVPEEIEDEEEQEEEEDHDYYEKDFA